MVLSKKHLTNACSNIHTQTQLNYFLEDKKKIKANTSMLKWCIKVLLYQFRTSNQITTLRVKYFHQSWQKRPKTKKFLRLQTISRWDLCRKKNRTKWTSTKKCKKTAFSLQKLQFKTRTPSRRRTRVTTKKSLKILSKSNKMERKMMKTSLILERPKWISSRKEQEKYWLLMLN